jgi:hypothetical protein
MCVRLLLYTKESDERWMYYGAVEVYKRNDRLESVAVYSEYGRAGPTDMSSQRHEGNESGEVDAEE